MSGNIVTLSILKHTFKNHRGDQCEYVIRLDNFTLTSLNTVDEGITVEDCARRIDAYVTGLRRKLNLFVAVEIHRENIKRVSG